MYYGLLRAKAALISGKVIRVISPSDTKKFPDDSFAYSIAWLGAPTVLQEKIPSGREYERCLQGLEKHLSGESKGKKASAITSLEIGGCNAIEPMYDVTL